MKTFSGKSVILGFAIVCVAMALVLYKTFKESGNYKELVLSQMHKEFLDYTLLKRQGSSLIPVAEIQGKTYSVDLKKDWSFQLHDKLLVVKAPSIEPTPEAAIKAEVEASAQKKLGESLKEWILDKFHTLDKINFTLEFQ